MLRRLLLPELRRRLARYPAVAQVGPRQCGKTTLAQALGGAYYDLEQESERRRLDLEWADRTAGRQRIILDEAQAWPEIFARVRGAIDHDRKRHGQFLLLGSVAPALAAHATESLAGRLSTLELTPLRWSELTPTRRAPHWLRGGFPDGGILDASALPEWQRDYLDLVLRRQRRDSCPRRGGAAKEWHARVKGGCGNLLHYHLRVFDDERVRVAGAKVLVHDAPDRRVRHPWRYRPCLLRSIP
jgi:uncharacterized protein